MRDFLSTPFLGNTAQDWMIALAVALVVMALVRVAIRLILRRLKSVAAKTDTDVDDLIAELLGKTQFLFVVLVALYAGAVTLDLPAGIESRLSTVLILGFLIQAALWADRFVCLRVRLNTLLGGAGGKYFNDGPPSTPQGGGWTRDDDQPLHSTVGTGGSTPMTVQPSIPQAAG